MVNIQYANAYTEVLEILKYIPIYDYKKVPKDTIILFETNSNKDYKFEYNPEKTLEEQGVSKIGKTIIAILFRDYWATIEQRERIVAKEKYDMQIKNNYNSNNLFEYNKKTKIKLETTLPIEVKKKNIFVKFIEYIKKLLFH